ARGECWTGGSGRVRVMRHQPIASSASFAQVAPYMLPRVQSCLVSIAKAACVPLSQSHKRVEVRASVIIVFQAGAPGAESRVVSHAARHVSRAVQSFPA